MKKTALAESLPFSQALVVPGLLLPCASSRPEGRIEPAALYPANRAVDRLVFRRRKRRALRRHTRKTVGINQCAWGDGGV
jgi:hypothetical protein